MILMVFAVGMLAGCCLVLASGCCALFRETRSLNKRLQEQQGWLAKLDEDFDRLSLELWSIRKGQRDGREPSEAEMRRAEQSLLEMLTQLIENRVMA